MAIPVRLLFKGNRIYGVGRLSFDLILSENHNRSNDITDFNVEDGTIISDHIKKNLENGSLSGLVSNFSLNTFGNIFNRSQDAFNVMEEIMNEQTLVTIVTVLKVYENVGITSVDVVQTSESGESIVLDVTFKQVNVVKLKTVQIDLDVKVPNMDNDVNRQAAPTAELGRTVGVS